MAKNQSRIENPSYGVTLTGHIGKPVWVPQGITHVVGFVLALRRIKVYNSVN
jgi:hypothetical protein